MAEQAPLKRTVASSNLASGAMAIKGKEFVQLVEKLADFFDKNQENLSLRFVNAMSDAARADKNMKSYSLFFLEESEEHAVFFEPRCLSQPYRCNRNGRYTFFSPRTLYILSFYMRRNYDSHGGHIVFNEMRIACINSKDQLLQTVYPHTNIAGRVCMGSGTAHFDPYAGIADNMSVGTFLTKIVGVINEFWARKFSYSIEVIDEPFKTIFEKHFGVRPISHEEVMAFVIDNGRMDWDKIPIRKKDDELRVGYNNLGIKEDLILKPSNLKKKIKALA